MSAPKTALSALLVLTLALATASPSRAYKEAKEGARAIHGVIVTDGSEIFLLANPGNRSEQSYIVRGFNFSTQTRIASLAVAQQAKPANYPADKRHDFTGTIRREELGESKMGLMYIVETIDGQEVSSSFPLLIPSRSAFRKSLMAENKEAVTRALTVLERSNCLDKALSAAIKAAP